MMGGDEQFEWQAILTKYYLNLALYRQIFGALIQIVVSWTENRYSTKFLFCKFLPLHILLIHQKFKLAKKQLQKIIIIVNKDQRGRYVHT